MILVGAHIAQDERSRVVLGYDQVRGSVTVDIGGDQSTRRVQLHVVKAERVTHILKAAIATNCETRAPWGPPAFQRLRPGQSSRRYQYRWASVPSAQCTVQGQFNAAEGAACVVSSFNVAPKRDARSPRMSHRDIHPAVLVEVEHCDTDCGGQVGPE